MGEERKARRKHWNQREVRDELREMIPESHYQQMRFLNFIERVAGYWYQAAGGDAAEFEEWFNRQEK